MWRPLCGRKCNSAAALRGGRGSRIEFRQIGQLRVFDKSGAVAPTFCPEAKNPEVYRRRAEQGLGTSRDESTRPITILS